MDSSILSFFSIILVGLLTGLVRSFDPLMDSHPYSISWGGPLNINKEEVELLGDRHILVTTNNEERYQCILPETKTDKKDGSDQFNGPSATELLKPLFSQKDCSYRIESYWSYELCHGKHLKQYHETREPGTQPKKQEYFLGFGNHREKGKKDAAADEKTPDEEKPSASPPTKELEGEDLPYYEVIMSDGTKCDLTNQPRKAHVLYVCFKGGRGEVYELKEVSTCEYEVVVLTTLLCSHPDFKPKPKAVSEIKCHSFIDSPIKPSQLVTVEHEGKFFQAVGQDFTVPEPKSQPSSSSTTSKQPPQPEVKVMIHRKTTETPSVTTPPPSRLGAITDKQTLRDFFGGNKCLRGGHGWWKHEICFEKHAKQFHTFENGKETSIYLGFWDKSKHLKWLNENPLKRPKSLNIRKHVSMNYTNGDICDLTKKARSCEVRLKCIENTKHPHAVMLSLAEPSPCQYVLIVESALFCPILKNANNDGIFENLDLS